MIVAFTGYRMQNMPFEESKMDEHYKKFREVELKVINRLIELDCTHFISGIALGFDTWVAEDVLDLRKKNKTLTLECAIPSTDQADRWPMADQLRRKKILRHADEKYAACEKYQDDCYHIRNRYMVDKSDVVVCAYDGKPGGTAYTVRYALQQNKIVIQINPSTCQVTMLSKRTFNS